MPKCAVKTPTGFPLTLSPTFVIGEPCGNDSRGKQGHTISPPSFPLSPLRHFCPSPSVISALPPPSFPTSSIPRCHSRHFQSGIQGFFPCRCRPNKRPEEKETGFPLTLSPTFVIGEPCGNDSRGKQGHTISPLSFPHAPSVILDNYDETMTLILNIKSVIIDNVQSSSRLESS